MSDPKDALTSDDLLFDDVKPIQISNVSFSQPEDTHQEASSYSEAPREDNSHDLDDASRPAMHPGDRMHPHDMLHADARDMYEADQQPMSDEYSSQPQQSNRYERGPRNRDGERRFGDRRNGDRRDVRRDGNRDRNAGRRPSYEIRKDVPLEERIQEDMQNAIPGKGILEITPSGFGFLRPRFTPSNDDIYVSQSQIRKFWLRPGDLVEGLVRPPKENEKYHGLLKIEKVNDVARTEEESRARKNFDEMTSLYPDRQIVLETEKDVLSTRIIDMLSPIGFGQRGLIVSPPKAGKTTLLKNIAKGIRANYPEAHLIAVLIGERPEEVTDVTRSMDAEVVSSHFDQSPRDQIRAAEIGLERAKRLVEEGKDVIILLDSITRLARAYNMAVNPSGRTLSGGFDPAALYPAKKFLGAARNCEEGGSLTIIGTALVNTESRMDDLIYEEFKGTGNMEVHLDRNFANKRIYPAIDIEASGTRHDDLLIGEEALGAITILRRMIGLMDKDEKLTLMIDKLSKTDSNKDFLAEISRGK